MNNNSLPTSNSSSLSPKISNNDNNKNNNLLLNKNANELILEIIYWERRATKMEKSIILSHQEVQKLQRKIRKLCAKLSLYSLRHLNWLEHKTKMEKEINKWKNKCDEISTAPNSRMDSH